MYVTLARNIKTTFASLLEYFKVVCIFFVWLSCFVTSLNVSALTVDAANAGETEHKNELTKSTRTSPRWPLLRPYLRKSLVARKPLRRQIFKKLKRNNCGEPHHHHLIDIENLIDQSSHRSSMQLSTLGNQFPLCRSNK